eukprot:7804700-Alexandrium_andersonii.AAC.1
MWLPSRPSGVPEGPVHLHTGHFYAGIGLLSEWGRRRVERTLERHLDPEGRDARRVRALWQEADFAFYDTAEM